MYELFCILWCVLQVVVVGVCCCVLRSGPGLWYVCMGLPLGAWMRVPGIFDPIGS